METLLFNILDRVDSTNNYAMARVHEGLAMHGQAWFAYHQEKGKGQRGRSWQSNPGENLILSVSVRPPAGYDISKFHFHALVSLAVAEFLEAECGPAISIKWPNDLYVGDRKAGGILIENVLQGSDWKWSVMGFGINLNQQSFPAPVPNAVSLGQITGKRYDALSLAKKLHLHILQVIDSAPRTTQGKAELIAAFNNKLYRRGSKIRLRSGTRVFEPLLKEVDEYGRLVITDVFDSAFSHGDVEWISLQ